MNRRQFVSAVTSGLLAASFGIAVAQGARIARAGWLSLGSLLYPDTLVPPGLVAGLRELGWILGRNIVFESRFANNEPERLAILAAELLSLKVNLLVTEGTLTALAAKKATSVIPIVSAGCSNPVERGLVQSMARPGGNFTGMTNNTGAGFNPKIAQLLKEAVPSVARVAVLWSPGERHVLEELQQASAALGMEFLDAGAASSEEIPVALAAAVNARADALFLNASSLNRSNGEVIASFALANRLPLICGHRTTVEAGGLMSYWTDFREVHRQSAAYMDKILKGAKPAELAMQQPTKFDLTINLKTAHALGLKIPEPLLLRADLVIR
jgi:putative ABC transport system substrate-binding protein